MARPKKQKHEQRSEPLSSWATPAELEYIRNQADSAGISVAEYLRARALGYQIRIPRAQIDAQLLTELNAIGINVNQIARALNRGRDEPHGWEGIQDELARLLRQVSEAFDGA